jgi:peptidoglycan/xylan/chitin deacetylase (PgdA/CDA1 family)/folate-dependent phosphoribosylglycinamide formyltransferase PurN
MDNPKLRVAFLVGSDNASTRLSIEAVCRSPGVEPVGVLLDTEVDSFKRRLKNLSRNIRKNGWGYLIFRPLEASRRITDTAVENAAVSRAEIMKVLREAFPERCFSLADLAAKYGMKVHAVGSLNGANAARVLGECDADLGIVMGTRILKPGTFGVPRMGCVNLHKGRVPEYRGMPPGFWELYDGASSAGVTVHFIDKGLDTGDIVATSTVPIVGTDTPDSLVEKLHEEGARLLASVVSTIRSGKATPQPRGKLPIKPHTRPTRKEIASLRRRLPHWKHRGDLLTILRNLYLLLVYYCGIYSLVRQYHRLRGRSRAAIYLYHRVNDYSKDILSVDTTTFAAQLVAIHRRYPVSPTYRIVECIRNGKPLQPTTIAIHFDDCYRGILTNGAPIMKALGIKGCAFINSGFVDTDRSFAHDVAKYPFHYEMLRSSDIQAWSNLGFEVGAHTVNHVDLGRCTVEAANSEIVECGQALQKIIGKPTDLFSFPFGRLDNIRSETKQAISAAGYVALFSSHGGFIGPRTDPYDIPRMGSSCESSPVYCLLEIEGLALHQVTSVFRRNGDRSAEAEC